MKWYFSKNLKIVEFPKCKTPTENSRWRDIEKENEHSFKFLFSYSIHLHDVIATLTCKERGANHGEPDCTRLNEHYIQQ